MTVLAGARVVTPGGVLDPGVVRLAGTRIADVAAGVPPGGEPAVCLVGRWLVPGYIDLHVHGGGGASYTTGDSEQARAAAAFHRAHGTTTTMASLVTAPVEDLERAVRALGELARDGELAGVHLEGPFLSHRHRGAHDPTALRVPDVAELARLLEAGAGMVLMVTLAPELPRALDLVRSGVAAGAVVAMGHTDATYEQATAAIDSGARLATHLFNGMRALHHREPGAALAALEDERVTVELINDGVHLHDAATRLAFAAAGPARVCLITDAISAAGMGDGLYRLGSMRVRVRGGAARLIDGSSIAGSRLTMDVAVRRAVHHVGVPIADAVRAASSTPARVLGIDDRTGSIEAGKQADLVVLDDDLHVIAVMARGSWVGPTPTLRPWAGST